MLKQKIVDSGHETRAGCICKNSKKKWDLNKQLCLNARSVCDSFMKMVTNVMGVTGPIGKLSTWLRHWIVALLQLYFVQFE